MNKKVSKRNENKMKNRELIIATAEKLILQKNFEDTSMDDVAKESGLTKRTIYKHFISKEDLFFAVTVEVTKKFISYSEEAIKDGKNALDKIRLSNKAYCQFYFDNPGMFRLMNYQPDNMHNCEASPSRHELMSLKDMSIRKYADIIEEGKTDGSINSKLDTKKSVYFSMFASMGLLNLVSNMDQQFFWEGQEVDETEFLNFSMDLFTDALT